MKSTSLATKLITLVLLLGVLTYFGVQAWRYFVDPETTALVYAYRSERTLDLMYGSM